MNATPKRTTVPSDLAALRKQLGTDNADAVGNFVDGRIAAALEPVLGRLDELVAVQAANVQAARQLSAEEREQVKAVVDTASVEVSKAADKADAASDKAAAGEVVSTTELAEVEEAAAAAEKAVDKASKSLEVRVSALEETVAGHGQSIASLGARMDQVEAGIREVQVVSATAYASAEAGDVTYVWRRAGMTALVAGGIAFLLYLLILLGPATWDWNWALGFPAIVAGITAAIVFMLSHDDGPFATSVAAADAIVARWSNLPATVDQHDEVVDVNIVHTDASAQANVR